MASIFALGVDGVVQQTFAEAPALPDPLPEGWALIDASGTPDVADGWLVGADGALSAPEPLPEGETPVPAQVSSAQAKIALKRAGYLPAVKDAIDALGDEEVGIWFTDARVWERSNPYVAQIGPAVGLDEAAIDALFRQAAEIRA